MKIEMGTNVVDTTKYDIVTPSVVPNYIIWKDYTLCENIPPIKSDTKVVDLIQNGAYTQAFLSLYFDRDNNGIIDDNEAKKIETSVIDFSENCTSFFVYNITNPKDIQVFENLSIPKSDEYYSSGTIPVAVVDGFNEGDDEHGIIVSNILKQYNPDIAITKYNYHHDDVVIVVPKNFHCGGCHKTGETYEVIVNPLMRLKQNVFFGKKYAAINLSMGYTMDYETINALCSKDLKVRLTPENIAQYKTQIKEILWEKCRKNPDLTYTNTRTKEEINIRDVLQEIEIFDSLDIPIYVAQSYKSEEYTKETFNLFSLINTAVTVEAGTETTRPLSSSNSFSVDEKTGKKRFAEGLAFIGTVTDLEINKNSTSFATPEFLAKTLKKQPVNTAHTAEARTETTRPFRSSNSFAIDEPTEEKRIVQRLNRAGTVTDNFSTSPATLGFLPKVPKKQYRSCLK